MNGQVGTEVVGAGSKEVLECETDVEELPRH